MTTATPAPPLARPTLPGQSGATSINVEVGKPIFILGRNGTGKSALVHRLLGMLGTQVVYLPGSRPNYFDNESLSMGPAARRQLTTNLRSWDSSPDTRWHSPSGTSRNEKAIHDLYTAEMQYNVDAANEIKRDGGASKAILRLQSNVSPLDRVNALFAQANLPVRTVIESGELKAVWNGDIYSIAKTSDGERAALVLTAEVVAAADNTIFLVDEPELHLHPSIVVPLISALIAEKPNCAFIVSTHELDLPGICPSAKVILVRGCSWQNQVVRAWDIDILDDASQIPESLRVDVIGSRRTILFVEGKSSSLDQPLYELLFPSISIRARDNCREVMRAVAGLRSIEALHRVSAFGLVDNDGMEADRLEALEAKGIYPLPIFSVESFYYSAEVLRAVAYQQSQTLGVSADELLSHAKVLALATLQPIGRVEHLAGRVAEQQMRERVMLAMPDRQSMIDGNETPITISMQSPYPGELAKIRGLVAAEDIDGIVSRYPVRESGILGALAKGLRFIGQQDYEKAALARIGADTTLQSILKLKLGNLAAKLQ